MPLNIQHHPHFKSSFYVQCLYLLSVLIYEWSKLLVILTIISSNFGDIYVSQDVRVWKYIYVNIPHQKSHQTTLRLQENTTSTCLCPYQVGMRYLDLRKNSSCSEPLFSFMDGIPISRQYFKQQLQAALSFCDLNLQNYHTHIFRIRQHLQLRPKVYKSTNSDYGSMELSELHQNSNSTIITAFFIQILNTNT